MEWTLAVACMVPAAISDLRYRAASLDLCIAVMLLGSAIFAWWALSAPLHAVVTGLIVTGIASVLVWAGGRYMGAGDGDWWFMAGACAALSTLDPLTAPTLMFTAAYGAVILFHVAMCACRPELPFPQRLYEHMKRRGDTFRVGVDSGELVPVDESGMLVRPGLPVVTFMAAATLIVGVLLSV